MRSNVRLSITFMLASLLTLAGLSTPAAPAGAQSNQLCFPTVPGITNCIEGRFLQYWQQNGGLEVFGYPLTAPANQQTAEGIFLTQTFERNSFELHPDKSAPYDVLLGRLGGLLLERQGINWQSLPKASSSAAHYFAETGHAVTHEPFYQYWSTHGLQDSTLSSYQRSLALFGFPLTEAAMATNSSGDNVLTQWFERARFEYHPNEPDPYKVLLGLLGKEWISTGPPPAPAPLPGTSWVLTLLNGQLPVTGTTITISFGTDGKVSGSDGCNSYNAAYTVSGSSLTIPGPIAGTQIACPDPIMQQATAYQTALTRTASYSVDGQQLLLKDSSGAALATFIAQPVGLANTSWNVLSYNNGAGAVVSVLNGTSLTASFTATDISGFAGCNDYSGTYQTDGTRTITLGPLATTRKACSDPAGVMDQETRYLVALQSAATYTVTGNDLELRTASGSIAATFRRR